MLGGVILTVVQDQVGGGHHFQVALHCHNAALLQSQSALDRVNGSVG